jgi:hypothetical protein
MKPPVTTEIKKPSTPEEWAALDFDIAALFDGAPVDEEQLFAGRIDAYRAATRTNQRNFLKESLLACALARTDDEGFFTATDVVEPYSAIVGAERRIAHFEKHLRRFSSEDGGNILIKRGGERQQTFRFKDPMMQPYVIIRGIQSGMVPESAKNLLLQKQQRELSI